MTFGAFEISRSGYSIRGDGCVSQDRGDRVYGGRARIWTWIPNQLAETMRVTTNVLRAAPLVAVTVMGYTPGGVLPVSGGGEEEVEDEVELPQPESGISSRAATRTEVATERRSRLRKRNNVSKSAVVRSRGMVSAEGVTAARLPAEVVTVRVVCTDVESGAEAGEKVQAAPRGRPAVQAN